MNNFAVHKKKMSIKVASFDVGTRNLGLAIISVKLPDPLDKNKHKELITETTKPCDGFFAPWTDVVLHHLEKIDVLIDNDDEETTNSNLISMAKWIPLIQHTLRTRLHLIQSCDVILIESQPSFGREKIKMISFLIHAFFSQYFFGQTDTPIVGFASSQMKLQVVIDPRNFYQIATKPREEKKRRNEEAEQKTPQFVDLFGVVPKRGRKPKKREAYQSRKLDAIHLAGNVLMHLQAPQHLVNRFHAAAKKDDYADSLLQGIAYLQRTPPRRRGPPTSSHNTQNSL